MKIETINANHEDIFRALDDALFWGDITKIDLESYLGVAEEKTEIDGFVRVAIERALNISLPDRPGWYNGSKGKNK